MDSQDNETKCKKYFENLLRRNGANIEISDMSTTPGCQSGENFVSEVFRVSLRGRYIYPKDEKDFKVNFIIKRVPDPSSPFHHLYDCWRMFRNEITAYETVVQVFQQCLDKTSRTLCFPTYHGSSDDFIALQDLKTCGYRMIDRLQGLTFKECQLVLDELASFHSASLHLKSQSSQRFSEIAEKLQETVFCRDYIDGTMGTHWENAVRLAIESLKQSGDANLIQVANSLNSYSGHVLQTLIDLTKPTEPFSVVCHGDLWNNNVMFRHDASDNPVCVKMLDLQAFRCCSCVLDVLHVIFTSTSAGFVKAHFQDLLFMYYDALADNLSKLGTSISFTKQELLCETKSKVQYGLFLSFIMLPWATRLKDQPDESKLEFDELYESLSPLYHTKLRTLVSDLLKLRFL